MVAMLRNDVSDVCIDSEEKSAQCPGARREWSCHPRRLHDLRQACITCREKTLTRKRLTAYCAANLLPMGAAADPKTRLEGSNSGESDRNYAQLLASCGMCWWEVEGDSSVRVSH